MLPQSEIESPMIASAQAPVAIAALTQDRALIGLLRSVVDPSTDLILVTSEADLTPHLNSRRVSVALLDSMFVEGDLAGLAERLRETWNDLVLVVVGTAEEQGKVASQITSGVVYRFLHRPVSAPRVRLFVEAALRRHEVENVERTLETARPDFSGLEAPKPETSSSSGGASMRYAIIGLVLAVATVGGWYIFSGGKSPEDAVAAAQVVSEPAADTNAEADAAVSAPAEDSGPTEVSDAIPPDTAEVPAAAEPVAAAPPPVQQPATQAPQSAAPAATPAASKPEPAETQAVAERLPEAAPAATPPAEPARVQRTDESPVERVAPAAAPPPPVLTREQRLKEQLAQAEAALQRGDLANPPGRNAVELFGDALELDPGNTLAKAGLVRVADRLLSNAERALTAGKPQDAKKMVDIAETLTPATARGAFLMMQIELEHERAALTAKNSSDAQDRQERGATYLRLANTRLRSGALIEPAEDNARFYLEAARQTVPDDPAVQEISRTLQKELLARAGAAASAGNAADTERWLANADGAGAPRQEMTNIRRMLHDTLNGARTDKASALAQSFNTALSGNKLLQPSDSSAKAYYLDLIETDAANPAVAAARQGLGSAYLREMRSALGRGDIPAADAWLVEARTISFTSADLNAAESELAAARDAAAQRDSVVAASSLPRIEYVAPKFPPTAGRNREMNGWVEVEFTVMPDGSTGNITVTNSNPRRVFDSSAVNAIRQWRYKPVVRGGKAVEQRASVRIRFTEE
jgi:TonB family protein